MKKLITKTTAAVLLLVLMFTGVFAFTANAEEYDYEYTDISPTISTEASFEKTFGASSINKVMYDYYVYNSETLKYTVILTFTMRVGNKDYTAIAEGVIKPYSLPSGNTLVEGPIDGTILIGNHTYKLTVGFAWLEESEQAMISITMDGTDGSLVAFSFGENIIQGEVLDLLTQRVSNGNDISNSLGNEIEEDISFANSSESIAPLALLPPINLPYDPPSDDEEVDPDLNLGENGEYKFQTAEFAYWENTTYKGLESGVYFDQSRNLLMATLRPFSSYTESYIVEKYVTNGGYDYAGISLYSFGVELVLEDSPAESYAYIACFDKPQDTTGITDFYNFVEVNILPLFEDVLSLVGVPTSVITNTLAEITGKISVHDERLISRVDIQLAAVQLINTDNLEDIYTGLPFKFQLAKGNSSTYVGDTAYAVNMYSTYYVLVESRPLLSAPQYNYFYITSNTSHEGVIDLG